MRVLSFLATAFVGINMHNIFRDNFIISPNSQNEKIHIRVIKHDYITWPSLDGSRLLSTLVVKTQKAVGQL